MVVNTDLTSVHVSIVSLDPRVFNGTPMAMH